MMGLFGVPGTATWTTQLLRERHEPGNLTGDGVLPCINEHGREVIGFDGAVEFGERQLGDLLVGETETLQHHDRRLGGERVEQHQLELRHGRPVDAMTDQHRAHSSRHAGGEVLGIEDVNPGHRITAQARPREVDERESRNDSDAELVGLGRA